MEVLSSEASRPFNVQLYGSNEKDGRRSRLTDNSECNFGFQLELAARNERSCEVKMWKDFSYRERLSSSREEDSWVTNLIVYAFNYVINRKRSIHSDRRRTSFLKKNLTFRYWLIHLLCIHKAKSPIADCKKHFTNTKCASAITSRKRNIVERILNAFAYVRLFVVTRHQYRRASGNVLRAFLPSRWHKFICVSISPTTGQFDSPTGDRHTTRLCLSGIETKRKRILAKQ